MLCSNPGCRALTVGPTKSKSKVSRVGEAAHIYGGKPGSARYRTDMSDKARSSVSNAIWLCKICHKKVDDDAIGYPADLLFAWLREHEEFAAQSLGRPGMVVSRSVERARGERFSVYGPRAQRLVETKPEGWEHLLTSELLRVILEPHRRRLKDLDRGFYYVPGRAKRGREAFAFLRTALSDIQRFMAVLGRLYVEAIQESWGAPGEPGDEVEIEAACLRVGECVSRIVDWEEEVEFSLEDEELEIFRRKLRDAGARQIREVQKIPEILDGFVEAVLSMPEDERAA